ncbi:MAG: hypothetical protein FRX48_01043 [Lasallia pustulata]|uniref:Increased loss of mitochondrial DNA protein 1 n=1 Tax=Lasallia pustulata TaxID=136370 RepID=A0A5M8Q562_9LECA|nr:MAG: hypothetical protein FRX48_01043 [Lasallia pustulata]
MAILSAASIIRSLSLLHLTLAYFFLTSPATIGDQNLVFILGAAMGLPDAPSFTTPSAPTAFLAILLALLGLSDLTAASLPEEIGSYYWSSQAPVRLFFFFVVTGYTYLFKPGGMGLGLVSKSGAHTAGVGDELKNSVVFTWGFVEVICWFWIYVTLRDERRETVARAVAKRKAEEDML